MPVPAAGPVAKGEDNGGAEAEEEMVPLVHNEDEELHVSLHVAQPMAMGDCVPLAVEVALPEALPVTLPVALPVALPVVLPVAATLHVAAAEPVEGGEAVDLAELKTPSMGDMVATPVAVAGEERVVAVGSGEQVYDAVPVLRATGLRTRVAVLADKATTQPVEEIEEVAAAD